MSSHVSPEQGVEALDQVALTNVKEMSPLAVAVALIQRDYEIILTQSGRGYAIKRSGPKVAVLLDSATQAIRDPLTRDMLVLGKRAATDTIEQAMSVCRAEATRRDVPDLPVRAFEASDALYIDIGDETGEVIEVTETGWQILKEAPVVFARSELTASIPRPSTDGDVRKIFELVNVAPEDHDLFLGCLVSAFEVANPRPILLFRGEQGSGKTENANVFVSLTDPSLAPTRSLATKSRDWEAMLPKSSVVAIDNVTRISQEMSDAMCRACTGSSAVTRSLYTDSKASVSTAKVMQIITTIALEELPDDLMDRAVLFTVPTIGARHRMTGAALKKSREQLLPIVFGGLLDLLVQVRAAKAHVELEELPRMADFGLTLGALDCVLGSQSLARNAESAQELIADALGDDPFLRAVKDSATCYQGTVSEILTEVRNFAKTRQTMTSVVYEGLWTIETRTLGKQLVKTADSLRKLGWTAKKTDRRNSKHMNIWTIAPPGTTPPTG